MEISYITEQIRIERTLTIKHKEMMSEADWEKGQRREFRTDPRSHTL